MSSSCFRNSQQFSMVNFNQMPKDVQDSILKMQSSIQKTKNLTEMVDLMDFTNNYSLEIKLWHNWFDKIILKERNGNKQYVFRDNEALPFIIYEKSLYIPTEYNFWYMSINENTLFKKIELKE